MSGREYRIYPSTVLVIEDDIAIDEERLRRLTFHIEAGDYLPYVATVVGFAKESLLTRKRPTALEKQQAEELQALRDDLIHIHERYTLVPKAVPLAYVKEKMIRFMHDHPRNHQERDS